MEEVITFVKDLDVLTVVLCVVILGAILISSASMLSLPRLTKEDELQ